MALPNSIVNGKGNLIDAVALMANFNALLQLAGGTMSGPIAMGSQKITGLAAGTANGDALRYEQLVGLYLLLTGGTVTGNVVVTNGGGASPVEVRDASNSQGGYFGVIGAASSMDFYMAVNRALNGTYKQTGQAAASIGLHSGNGDGNITFYTTPTNNSSMVLALTIDKNGLCTFTKNIAFSPTTSGIVGTPTNDSATSGIVGQYIESVFSNISYPATTVYGDASSISLTAGDWDVTLNAIPTANGATITAQSLGISITSGNSTTGLVQGSNHINFGQLFTANNVPMVIANYRISLASTTTVYTKFEAAFSGGTPSISGRLSARRMR